MIAQRKITAGIVASVVIIGLKLWEGIFLFQTTKFQILGSFSSKQIINSIILYSCYIATWVVIKDILVVGYGLGQFNKNIRWFIQLMAASAVSTLFSWFFAVEYARLVLGLTGILSLIFFLIIFVQLTKVDTKESPPIRILRSFMILLLVTSFVGSFLKNFGDLQRYFDAMRNWPDIGLFAYFIVTIPYIFLALFFVRAGKQLNSAPPRVG